MACVYKITNKITGRFYIGSTNNLQRRKTEHFGELKRKEHHSKLMQYDYENYGKESFVVEVLEYCDECVKRDREQYYIDLLKPVENGYNSSHSAYANDSLPPRYGEKNSFYGKKHSEETKRILSERMKSHTGWKHTEETKNKMRNSSKRGKNANATHVLQYDLNMNFIKEWNCIADICDFYGWKSHSHVSNCCERNYLHRREKWCTAKGFIWKYKDSPKKKGVVK